MSKKSRKNSAVEATRAKIVEAVFAIATDDAPANITMEMVAEKLGMSRGNIYNYFSSTDDLLLYVLEKMQEIYTQDNWDSIHPETSMIESLRAMARAMLNFNDRAARLYSHNNMQSVGRRDKKNRQISQTQSGPGGKDIRERAPTSVFPRHTHQRHPVVFLRDRTRYAMLIRNATPPAERRSLEEEVENIVERFLRGS